MQPGVHIARAFAVLLFWFRGCCFFSHFVAGTHRLPFSGVLTLIALLYFGLLDGLGLWFNLLGIPFFLFDFIKIKLWQFSFALIQIWLCSLIDAKIDEAGVDVESIQNILTYSIRNAQWISWLDAWEELFLVSCLHVLERTLTLQEGESLFYLVLLRDDDSGLSATRVRQAGLTAMNQEGAAVLRVELQSFSRLLMQLHGPHGVKVLVLNLLSWGFLKPIDIQWANSNLGKVQLELVLVSISQSIKIFSFDIALDYVILNDSLNILYWIRSWYPSWLLAYGCFVLEPKSLLSVLVCQGVLISVSRDLLSWTLKIEEVLLTEASMPGKTSEPA